jgi:hypothetical protein
VVLFTAGYEGRSLGDFLTALNASGVTNQYIFEKGRPMGVPFFMLSL